jgi:hypothetical protein
MARLRTVTTLQALQNKSFAVYPNSTSAEAAGGFSRSFITPAQASPVKLTAVQPPEQSRHIPWQWSAAYKPNRSSTI